MEQAEKDIKITASIDPSAPKLCRFTVDRPVYPEGSAWFPTIERASASPLALKIFGVEGVSAVRISGSIVTVTMESQDRRTMAKKIGEILRSHLKSGEASVQPSLLQKPSSPDEQIREKIEEIFSNQINPAVASHGGFVKLMDVKDGKVYLQMGGGCHGCGMADVTLKQGIEAAILEQVPEVTDVIDVTNHSQGTNPYL